MSKWCLTCRADNVVSQIHEACRQADDLDMRQADAVSARIDLDLRIGAAFTRLTSMSLGARVPEVAQQVVSYGKSFSVTATVAPK